MKDITIKLIIKHLQTTLSQEETDIFYDWIHADEENKKLFFEIKAIYEAAHSNKQQIDIEKSWQRLLKKRQLQSRQNIPWKKITSYVAVGLIAVSLTSLFFVFMQDKPEAAVSRYIGGDGIEVDVVVLSDETRVSLGSKTTFHYDPDYGRSNRNVYLQGEAYFEVEYKKENPFIVNINGMKVEALGTAFNVMAYPCDSLFTVTLLEGSIRLTVENIAKQTALKPDQQFIYNQNNHTTAIYDVDAKDYIAWTTGYYYFSEQPLKAILYRLSYVYGITFDVQSKKLNDMAFTGTFYRGQSAKNLMEIISLSVPIKYRINDHHVTIYE